MKSSAEIKKIARETIALEVEAIKKIYEVINDNFVKVKNVLCSSGSRRDRPP